MNIHDLAKHLNISIGTVSRALNGKADVNAKTRQRVIDAAEKFGYSPNQSGRSLRQGATGLVGFMVITNREREMRGEPFFMSIFDGMQSYLSTRGRDLVVHFCRSEEDPVAYTRRIVERGLVDGIIISQMHRTDKRIDFLTQRRMPFIAFGRSESTKAFSWMDLDFEGVAEKAINHLYLLGHRRIAIATSSNDVNYGYLFEDACRSSLLKRGIELPDEFVLREPLTESGGYRVGERLMAMERMPTAIVLVDNTLAIGLYHIFQDAKIVPGKDISIVGFDESPNGEFLRPSLTQFEVPLVQLGRWLGEHIVLLIEAKASGKKIPQYAKTWPMKMILGDSSGPAL